MTAEELDRWHRLWEGQAAARDPLSLFPKDKDGGPLERIYHPVPHYEVNKFEAIGWKKAPLTDPYFHPFDRYAVMMMWAGEGEMRLP